MREVRTESCYVGTGGLTAWLEVAVRDISLFIELGDELVVSAAAIGQSVSEEHRFVIGFGDKGHVYCGMDNAIALRDQLTTCIDQAILDDLEDKS